MRPNAHECAMRRFTIPDFSGLREDTLRPCWNQIRRARLRRHVGPGGWAMQSVDVVKLK